MLRQIRASRLKTFALIVITCAIALPGATILLWTRWHLDGMARRLAMPADPLSCGLVAALVPIWIAAIQIWLPVRRRHDEAPRPRTPLTEAQLHWNAVRIVALLCIVVMEILVQSIPSGRPAHAAVVGVR